MSPEIGPTAATSRKEKRKKDRKRKQKDDGNRDSVSSTKDKKKKTSHKKPQKSSSKHEKNKEDPYARFDEATAAALRQDDEEIAALEAKMGLSGSKEKNKLYKEYAKLECYGDDFGSFLDDVDTMVQRVVTAGDEDDEDYEAFRQQYGLMAGSDDDDDDDIPLSALLDDDEQEEEDDELVPMNDCLSEDDDGEMLPNSKEEEEQSDGDDDELNQGQQKMNAVKGHVGSDDDDDDDDDAASDEEDDKSQEKEPDHDLGDTYKPSEGEDIYGNPINQNGDDPAPKKYVPPHLRKRQQEANQPTSSSTSRTEEDEHARQMDEEKRKEIKRLLNNSLNRLSEDTMVSVAKAIAALYPSYPTAIVNECVWKNLQISCIERPHLMTGLIPVYVACLSGVHVQLGDAAQLGEFLLETTVTDLWKQLQQNKSAHGDDDIIQKDASNLMLILCYLYNYGIVHCSFLYSVIRSFIESFRDMEVELLLLMLSHCGRSLRSDDPTALKEIVLLVQKRALEIQKGTDAAAGSPLSSRVEYMVSAMMDLKNNKKRKADSTHVEKVSKLRKLLGQIKSTSSSSASRSSDSPSLRIGLEDILNATTKGRWWKIGASWVGNQYRFSEDGETENPQTKRNNGAEEANLDAKEDAKLLKLASKARMNTDTKRAIFCIIMKSADCEDAFEKLSRAGYMKNRKERDAVRVLMECCGNEKSYNPFYAHLAARMCDYQPQCKFSMQLAYWDIFKQFDDSVSVRKAANLAKLLFHLVIVHPSLRLNVLKALDMSSPDELSESAIIFLTIFFSKVMEHFDSPSNLKLFLESEVKKKPRRGGGDKNGSDDDDEGDMIGTETIDENNDDNDDGGLGPSISIFLLQTLKASPKYKKGSRFRTNLKAAVKACDTEDFFF